MTAQFSDTVMAVPVQRSLEGGYLKVRAHFEGQTYTARARACEQESAAYETLTHYIRLKIAADTGHPVYQRGADGKTRLVQKRADGSYAVLKGPPLPVT